MICQAFAHQAGKKFCRHHHFQPKVQKYLISPMVKSEVDSEKAINNLAKNSLTLMVHNAS